MNRPIAYIVIEDDNLMPSRLMEEKAKAHIMNQSFTVSRKAKLPKRYRKRPECPPAVAAAIKEYADKYKVVYKRPPTMIYDKAFGFIRIDGKDGIGLKRLKQLTQQLRERIKDMLT